MTANLAIRKSGWEIIPTNNLSEIYFKILSLEKTLKFNSQIKYTRSHSYQTLAESHGVYVREIYSVYKSFLDVMKIDRDWITLQVRNTQHSQAHWANSTSLEIDGEQFDVRAFQFDPQVFLFPWVDNSMTYPWTPWEWEIGLYSDDLDETHYFYNEKNKQLIKGSTPEEGELKIYNLSIELDQKLSCFKKI